MTKIKVREYYSKFFYEYAKEKNLLRPDIPQQKRSITLEINSDERKNRLWVMIFFDDNNNLIWDTNIKNMDDKLKQEILSAVNDYFKNEIANFEDEIKYQQYFKSEAYDYLSHIQRHMVTDKSALQAFIGKKCKVFTEKNIRIEYYGVMLAVTKDKVVLRFDSENIEEIKISEIVGVTAEPEENDND